MVKVWFLESKSQVLSRNHATSIFGISAIETSYLTAQERPRAVFMFTLASLWIYVIYNYIYTLIHPYWLATVLLSSRPISSLFHKETAVLMARCFINIWSLKKIIIRHSLGPIWNHILAWTFPGPICCFAVLQHFLLQAGFGHLQSLELQGHSIICKKPTGMGDPVPKAATRSNDDFLGGKSSSGNHVLGSTLMFRRFLSTIFGQEETPIQTCYELTGYG